MKKREFLRITGIAGAGLMVSPFFSCEPSNKTPEADLPEPKLADNTFSLPELGFAMNALEPRIDTRTMEIHHGKHHAGYVNKLNAALVETPELAGRSLEDLLATITEDQTALRNNGGGHFNHSLYWKVIAPGGGSAPVGDLATAINSSFGSQDAFAEEFFNAAKTRFGSGWAWLCLGADSKLFVCSTPNQDNPLMTNIAEQTGTPVLGIDVWEHAYYLNYQNKRSDYISAFIELVNWDQVSANFASATA
jgi:superoxide dismutase, Fe-Mn family